MIAGPFWGRLGRMPNLLLLFSVAPAVVMVLFSVAALLPTFQVEVVGKIVSHDIWWASGGGLLTLFGSVLFVVALSMLAFGRPYARACLVGAWLGFALASYVIVPSIAATVDAAPLDARLRVSLPIAIAGLICAVYVTFSKSTSRLAKRE